MRGRSQHGSSEMWGNRNMKARGRWLFHTIAQPPLPANHRAPAEQAQLAGPQQHPLISSHLDALDIVPLMHPHHIRQRRPPAALLPAQARKLVGAEDAPAYGTAGRLHWLVRCDRAVRGTANCTVYTTSQAKGRSRSVQERRGGSWVLGVRCASQSDSCVAPLAAHPQLPHKQQPAPPGLVRTCIHSSQASRSPAYTPTAPSSEPDPTDSTQQPAPPGLVRTCRRSTFSGGARSIVSLHPQQPEPSCCAVRGW